MPQTGVCLFPGTETHSLLPCRRMEDNRKGQNTAQVIRAHLNHGDLSNGADALFPCLGDESGLHGCCELVVSTFVTSHMWKDETPNPGFPVHRFLPRLSDSLSTQGRQLTAGPACKVFSFVCHFPSVLPFCESRHEDRRRNPGRS